MTTITTLILVIEGTVAPISFVKDVLFPYFLAKVPALTSSLEYPLNAGSSDAITSTAAQFPPEHTVSKEALQEQIESLVHNDIKEAVLKSLQGIGWEQGYDSGELKATA
mgnify:CR=1 FL=1